MMPLPADPADVSIVIVNWNSCRLLAACLRSIADSTSGIRLDVVVIDNASYDGSREMVEAEFPEVRYVEGLSNVGFARANNAAARLADGRSLLFLNPDTEVSQGAIERMLAFVEANPRAGAVGCRLLNSDGSLQTSCVQAFPTLANQILDSEWLRRLFPHSALWGTRAFAADRGTPQRVEAVSGACLLVRADAFTAVGGFTEDYFMYAEDIDLCFKLQRSGRENHYLGDVEVVHHGGQSSGASSESQFGNVLMRESISRFLRLHRSAAYAFAYRISVCLSAVARLATLRAAQILSFGRYPRPQSRGALHKWSRILRWSVGGEAWVRNPGARTS